MSMILLRPAYKILHTAVKFKRRTISVTPFLGSESPGGLVFSARLAVSLPAFRVVAAARSMPGAGT
jgi:hypothetical protein